MVTLPDRDGGDTKREGGRPTANATTANGNVRSCAVALTCQLWLGNAVSGLGVSLQSFPVPANKRHAAASSYILELFAEHRRHEQNRETTRGKHAAEHGDAD